MTVLKGVLNELKHVPTDSISDALDRLGVYNSLAVGLKPVFPSARIIGTAVTVRQVPARSGERGVRIWHVIEKVAKRGDVLVIDAGGDTKVNTLGGNQCLAAKLKGIAGAVVDGVVRDVEEIRECGFSVFSRGYSAIEDSPLRHATVCINDPVVIAETQVKAGDIIVADEDGVAVIPPKRLEEAIRLAKEKEEFDRISKQELRKGRIHDEILEIIRKRKAWLR